MDVSHIGFGGQESPILKTRIISVGLYNMEINNLFVLLIHQVQEILYLMIFHELRTMAILDVSHIGLGCQEGPILKTKITLVCLSCYNFHIK